MKIKPVVFGCAGLGGFAGSICDRLLTYSQLANPMVKLAAACDPEPERNPQRVAALHAAGVKVFQSFEELLAEPVEAVWLPLPIDLHRPFTEQALRAQKAVMVEKPAAGCVDDVDAMIAARDRSRLRVAVGFQDVYQPPSIEVKDRLLNGSLGKPKSATLLGCWPRGDRYYKRNTWAGKLQRNGTWILDSPASNALSHFIHLTMYLLGATPESAAAPVSVEAELYRANPIENFDTCTLRFHLTGGIEFVVALTHACEDTIEPEIEIATDRALIRMLPGRSIEFHAGGTIESINADSSRYGNVIGGFVKALRGVPDAPVGGTLEMARAHTVAVNGASQACAITDIPANFIAAATLKDGSPVRAIPAISSVLRTCVNKRQLLHETGLVPWSKPPGRLDLTGYRHFAGPRSA